MKTRKIYEKTKKELVTKPDEDGFMFAYYIAPNTTVLYRKKEDGKVWKMISDNIFAENKYVKDVTRPRNELKFLGENSKIYRKETTNRRNK